MGAGSFIAPWLDNQNKKSSAICTLIIHFDYSISSLATTGRKGSSSENLAMVVNMDLSQDFSHFEQRNSLPGSSYMS